MPRPRAVPGTLVANLASAASEFPVTPLVKDSRSTLTYAQFAERVEGAVDELAAAGARPGDRVMLCSVNRVESAILIWACARAGFIYAGLPTNLDPPSWEALIQNAEPAIVLADDERRVRPPHSVPLTDVLSGGTREWDSDRPQPDPDDIYALVYTSGTTGTPKGVTISHRATMTVAATYHDLLNLGVSEVTPIHLPFSYVSGHISQLNPIMLAGGTAVILPEFRPRTLIETIRRERATLLDLVPSMLAQLLREDGFTNRRLPSLRSIIYGGSSTPPGLLGALRERLPQVRLFDVYGMSETAGMISVRETTTTTPAGGTLIPSLHARVGDDEELLVRGGVVTDGYWANPAATSDRLQAGWLRTGDRASLLEDGTVAVLGRVAALINRGGVKIAPATVEDALRTHPAVTDAVAYGEPDQVGGEAVAATVVLGSPATTDELRIWVRGRLPVFARPRRIDVVTEIPRNPTGKADLRELRKLTRPDE